MKFGVVVFPGSNCDRDMMDAIGIHIGREVVELWHKSKDLNGCDFIVLPGGFSYGDYLRSGAIARFSPIMESVIAFAKKGGYVFGVCNGFQILCEAHLLPGALLHNESHKFVCKNVFIKTEHGNTLLTREIPKDKVLKIPIAHGEGRFYTDDKTLASMRDNGQIMFRYCDEQGSTNEKGNPNGSLYNIAGICNTGKNVFGMMPHPERAVDPALGNIDGKFIFDSILSVAKI